MYQDFSMSGQVSQDQPLRKGGDCRETVCYGHDSSRFDDQEIDGRQLLTGALGWEVVGSWTTSRLAGSGTGQARLQETSGVDVEAASCLSVTLFWS